MGFRLNVTGGAEQVVLDEKSIKNVVFGSESAKDSNARATDFGVSMKIWGKMLYKLGGENVCIQSFRWKTRQKIIKNLYKK